MTNLKVTILTLLACPAALALKMQDNSHRRLLVQRGDLVCSLTGEASVIVPDTTVAVKEASGMPSFMKGWTYEWRKLDSNPSGVNSMFSGGCAEEYCMGGSQTNGDNWDGSSVDITFSEVTAISSFRIFRMKTNTDGDALGKTPSIIKVEACDENDVCEEKAVKAVDWPFRSQYSTNWCKNYEPECYQGKYLDVHLDEPVCSQKFRITFGKSHRCRILTYSGALDCRSFQFSKVEITGGAGAMVSGGGKAGGDPHLLNVKGERFNIVRQGLAPLVRVASEGAAHLEVMALIQGVKKCHKKMFITQVNASGSWLEKTVAVRAGAQTDSKAFTVTVDGQEVWSPDNRGYQPPATDNHVFTHADKFSIHEMSRQATPAEKPGIELKTAHDVTMKIVRPLQRPTAPPHLNFDIQGLKNLPHSFKLGGLLGWEDHSYWSAHDEQCGENFANIQADETQPSSASAH